MEPEKLVKIIKSKQELKEIPVIVNADFGHTTPQFTFPIGGRGKLVARDGEVSFIIVEHRGRQRPARSTVVCSQYTSAAKRACYRVPHNLAN